MTVQDPDLLSTRAKRLLIPIAAKPKGASSEAAAAALRAIEDLERQRDDMAGAIRTLLALTGDEPGDDQDEAWARAEAAVRRPSVADLMGVHDA